MPGSSLAIVPRPSDRRRQVANNLPGTSGSFVGREQEVAAVCRLLAAPPVRLLTLVGPGGVGKTRLALAVAEEVLAEFADGVYWVELAAISDPELVLPAIATTLQVREAPPVPLIATLSAHLRGQRILLLLDNFEQILPAAASVAALLAACPTLTVLVTSRTALGVRAEQEFAVAPLALPDPQQHLSTAALLQYGAVALFVQQARALAPDLALTADNVRAIAEICRRVDGLPLAIELVAAHARLLAPPSILARLRHPLRLLAGGPPDAPSRQQTMRETIAWSYQLLGDAEQRLFRRLAVFAGGFEVRVAEAVCNDAGNLTLTVDDPQALAVLEGLEALVAQSLVRPLDPVEDGDRRLAMLETVREYAREQLAASGEAEIMQRRHADYYLWLAEQAVPGLEGPQQTAWLPRLDRDYDNLRAALLWLLAHGADPAQAEACAKQALHLLIKLRVFWDGIARPSEHIRWFEQALLQMGPAASPLRCRALRRGSIIARRQGDYRKATDWAKQALALAKVLGDKREIADALHPLSVMALVQGEYATARALMEESLVAYRELGLNTAIASTLNNLGEVARYQADYESAAGFYRQSLDLFRQQGDQTGIIEAVGNLGRCLHHLGRFAEAREALSEALGLAQGINAQARAAVALAGLAGLLLADTAGAAENLEQIARLCGLAAGLLERSGRQFEPLEQAEFAQTVARARAGLGDAAFTAAWAEGQGLSLDQAPELATHQDAPAQQPGKGMSQRAPRHSHALPPGGLTAREGEVTALVAQGLTNGAIAQRLVLSERTVEMHVSHALHKLGLTTRTQLATWATQQGLPPTKAPN